MPVETDKYVIATHALWAGDFAYCEALLREFSPPVETLTLEHAEHPEDIMRATGALRLKQLWQKRGEFRKLASEYAAQGASVTDMPVVLETKHLRATIWRTGEREFLMQGYLKELEWQHGLFERARREAMAHEPLKADVPYTSGELFPSASDDPIKPLGIAWAMTQNPFIQVELTDLGLLEATGLWIEPRLPQNAEAITGPFLQLLRALDEP